MFIMLSSEIGIAMELFVFRHAMTSIGSLSLPLGQTDINYQGGNQHF